MRTGIGRRGWASAVLVAALVALLLAAWGCGGGGSKGGSQAPPQNAVSYDPKLPLVLQFGRGSCPWCLKMEPILAELAADYRGKLNVSEVSVEEQEALAGRAGVRFLPTIIIYRPGGQEIYRHVGFWPKEEMVAKLRELGLIA